MFCGVNVENNLSLTFFLANQCFCNQALFTFLQMHFLFVNSTVIVERFGLFAR